MNLKTITPLKKFTYLEIMVTIVVLGIVMAPFIRMFNTGKKFSARTKEQVVALFLAMERLEEIQGLPFKEIKPDFDNFREIFKKEKQWADWGYNPEVFHRNFSDVWTPDLEKKMPKVTDSFLEIYKKVWRREFLMYPRGMEIYRRVTEVKTRLDEENGLPVKKEISVKVLERESNKILAELFLVKNDL